MRRILCAWMVLLLAGCGGQVDQVSQGGPPNAPPDPRLIVSLEEGLAAFPSARLLAARSMLEAGRVELVGNAVLVDVDEWTTFSEIPGALFDLPGWNARVGALGLTPETPVLVYDDGEMKFASRVRWLLSHYGVRETRIIRGGYPAVAARLPAGTGAHNVTTYPATVVEPPVPLIFKEQVAAALGNPAITIIDARIPEEYNGLAVLPGDARPGHIPGAVNFPIARLFGPNREMRDDAGMLLAFQQAGFRPDGTFYVYCHDGAQSSLVASALAQVGYRNVFLYYLSYQNWSKDFNLPVQL